MMVEACLAQGDNFWGVGDRDDVFPVVSRGLGSVVRLDTDRRVDNVKLCC